MPIDSNLAADFASMVERLNAKLGAMTTSQDLVSAFKDEVLPFLGNIVEEVGEIDGAVHDIIHDADDILQPETAAVIAQLLVASREMAKHFRSKVDKNVEPKVWAGLQTVLQLTNRVEELLNEITVIPDDDDDDDDDDDEEGDEEGDGDDDGEGEDDEDKDNAK